MQVTNSQLQVFVTSYVARLASPNMYYRVMKRLVEYIGETCNLSEEEIDFAKFHPVVDIRTNTVIAHVPINRNFIMEFLKHRLQEGDSDRTLYDTITCLKKLFGVLFLKNIVRPNPMVNIKRPKYEKAIRQVYLSQDECFRLLNAAANYTDFPEMSFAIVLTMLYTGIRNFELVKLTTFDINRNFMNLRIVRGKPKKTRYVPICQAVLKALDDYLSHPKRRDLTNKNILFLNEDGESLSGSDLRKKLKILIKKAGITKNITPHSLRHSAATSLWENGLDLEFIRQHLGVEHLPTAQIYTHIAPGPELRTTMEELPTTKFLYKILDSMEV